MAKSFLSLLFTFLLSSILLTTAARALTNESSFSTKTYIIHVNPPPPVHTTQSWHLSFFPQTTSAPPPILYSYKIAISGFAARLSDSELKAMKAKPGFLFSTADTLVPLATTHTPEFLGLLSSAGVKPEGLWSESDFGRGVIVAILDTGVMPNHPSFDDHGIGPPPEKWKGKCEFNASDCNNKIIGARAFLQGQLVRTVQVMGNDIVDAASPLDTVGHGTHTASTAAGTFVANASALGSAQGTAVGMAPNAHLAVYKVCTDFGCAYTDILAGIDAAIEEGADILSLSLGGDSMMFDVDPIAIGTFAAVEKGIFVSLAAGNSGPQHSSLSNEAPWMLTVGASTMDRAIQAKVKLGNGEEYEGESLYQTDLMAGELLPLVYPGASVTSMLSIEWEGEKSILALWLMRCITSPSSLPAKFCFNNSLNMDVKGKIVICDRRDQMPRIQQGDVIKGAGGAGMILAAAQSDGYTTVAEAHVIPTSHVSYPAASKIKSYINTTGSPTATIIPQGTLIGFNSLHAPIMACFSSRGPSLQSKGILKPDIIGPGVSVLAGWLALPIGPNNIPAIFNMLSGTSMSTPHLSGIAALLKKANPTWSPAAIRSAIMTTAKNVNTAGKPIQDEELNNADLFARGAGHVNPSNANNPGFVYDIQPSDYVAYLCGLNYSDTQVTVVARRTINCSTVDPIIDVELNYPTFSVEMRPGCSRKVNRTVKNVGEGSSSYEVEIVPPLGIVVTVSPTLLSFSEGGQELTYTVEFIREYGTISTMNYAEGYLTWVSSDKLISVRSQISITFT
ncbi:Subtilisin-like protease SDD1 [Dendrobium catenatum]|uniref:Subtilisin-like protease SDD1 n=1 Tax=Dendrobium catenatum TaxID=906689 RepID=A0A2I0VM89_9ASPA|nr:Subtilisin-like protease SDD1 [Dendrobium catenatum]